MRKQNTQFDDPLHRLAEQFAQAVAATPSIERALEPVREPPAERGTVPFCSQGIGNGDGPRHFSGRPTHFRQPSECELAPLIEALARRKSVRDQAELIRRQARKAHAGVEVENRAVVVRLRAERTAGGILTHLARHGGDHRSAAHSKLTVSSVGISQKHSSVWRREAAISDAHLEQFLADAKRRGARLSTADLLRFGELTEHRSTKRKH